jgi:hypothetical protein
METNSCYDMPDERDFKYSDICWNIDLPETFKIDLETDYQNQWLEEITQYMCVFFSSTHWVNIMNSLENFWEEVYKWKDVWIKAYELWRLDLTKWASIQDWPKTVRDLQHISSWFLVKWIDEIKQALYEWHPIVVGSNQLNWKENILKPWNGYWHAVLIIWWNKDGFIIKESYWKERWNNWTQLLPYEYLDKLYYSKYALVDNPNSILLYKQKIMEDIKLETAKLFVARWYTNWERPQDNITREEIWAIFERVLSNNWLK